jgi:pimeloyl-ACP methyl ester carboxylesterase
MKKSLSLAVALLFIGAALFAQDRRDSGRRLMPAPNAHSGSSPFDPPEQDDTLFVVDTGSGLDTGCTFRDGGPLRIRLLVKRHVGPINGDGTLSDPASMVSKGHISAKAQLFLPAFDIDVNGAPGFPPEVDRIFFNDHDLGTLTGDNGIWKLNSFEIPIEWVKFPAKGSPGSPPAPAENIIQINIDEASVPDFNWCMSVDWSQIEFKAIAPIFLVHGTNAQSDTWNPNFTAFFGNSGAPWSNDINLAANGSILGNGGLLASRVRELAQSFGAKKCHIIAHSKGGLDSRAFLNNNYTPDQLKVLSVFTLSTPHHGTIVSDIIVAKRASTSPESTNPDVQYLISHDYSFLSTPQPPAIENQTTVAMAAFNALYPSVPGEVKFYNYGADADLNHDGAIQANETADLIPGAVPNSMAAAAGTAMYRAIGNVAAISAVRRTRPGRIWGTNEYTAIEVTATNTPFQVNDLVTSVVSSRSPGGIFLGQRAANHSSMKTQALAGTILQRILSDFPAQ